MIMNQMCYYFLTLLEILIPAVRNIDPAEAFSQTQTNNMLIIQCVDDKIKKLFWKFMILIALNWTFSN